MPFLHNPDSLASVLFFLRARGALVQKRVFMGSLGQQLALDFDVDFPDTAPMLRVAGDQIVLIAVQVAANANNEAQLRSVGGDDLFSWRTSPQPSPMVPVFATADADADVELNNVGNISTGVGMFATLRKHIFGP